VTLVIAHRGASAVALENSLAAFRAAGPAGADGVELDVHASNDGTLFVHHDPVVDGLHIPRAAAADVRTRRLANGEPVPTLVEAIEAIDARLRLYIEVKSLPQQFDGKLFEILDKGDVAARCAVHGFDHRIVSRLGFARPRLSRGVLLASYPIRPLDVMEDSGATMLWEDHGLIDAALVDTLHSDGYEVFAWTVNIEAEMRRLIALEVDALCTNHPDVARRVVDSLA
jgi:glycerophosphoryl diester phosphodiesterase